MHRTMILLLVLLVTYIDAQFINITTQPDKKNGCSGETSSVNFNWNYATSTSVLVVEWKKDGSRIAREPIGLSQPFLPVGSYVGRLTKISNAQISLVNLSIADSGIYTCEVAYTNGNVYSSNSISLSVYDEWNNETKIYMTSGDGMVTLSAVFLDLSITYTWKFQNSVISVGSSLAVKKNGNYTLCVSGGRADCINPALSPCASIDVTGLNGLTTLSSAISSDISTTVSELLSTISSDMPTTVSEVPPPLVTTSSAGLSQEIVITIIISSILALGVLILLIVLVLKQCRQKNRQTPAKNKGNRFATKQGNFSKRDALKSSFKPRKSKFSGKRNTKQESISLDKFEHAQFKNSQAPKDRMYDHYAQTTDYMYFNNSGNQHDFNHSHAERNMSKYGNQHDRYPKSHSRPNNRIEYQSHYPEHPGHNEGMFQNYRVDKLYRGQQMYQGPYVAQYDHHNKNKPENKRRYEGRTYERNWDFLY